MTSGNVGRKAYYYSGATNLPVVRLGRLRARVSPVVLLSAALGTAVK